MLSASHRMRDGRQFSRTVRRGQRAARPTLVLHVIDGTDGDTSVGFVVSKAVGNAVVRNRVKRRLRHLMAARVESVPPGTQLVVRALAPAAAADSGRLAAEIDSALTSALAKLEARRGVSLP